MKAFLTAAAALVFTSTSAFAETAFLHTVSTGISTGATNDPSSPGPIFRAGKDYRLETTGSYELSSVEVSSDSNGERVETARGRTDISFTGNAGWITGQGYDTVITARFHEATNGSSGRSVDLTWSAFTWTGLLDTDLTYHIPLTGTTSSLAELLVPNQNLNFGSATAEFRIFNYYTSQAEHTIQLSATGGSIVSSVPEPATYAMLGAGLGLIVLGRRSRRTASSAQES